MTSAVVSSNQIATESHNSQENGIDEMESEINQLLTHMPIVTKVFTVIEKIGEGTFSKVFRARCRKDSASYEECALKYLIPTSHPTRIANEMRCLRDMGGSCNVMGVKMSFMEKGHVLIVMPYFPHDKFTDYFRRLLVAEVQDYMLNLFIALERVHSHGIIHRDVKPSNFLYNRKLQKYSLVDFGLAQRVEDLKNSAAIEHQQRHLLVDRKNKMNFEHDSKSLLGRLQKEKVTTERDSPIHDKSNKAVVAHKRLRSNGQENEALAPLSKRRKYSPSKPTSYNLLPPAFKVKNNPQSSTAFQKTSSKQNNVDDPDVSKTSTKISTPTSSKQKANSSRSGQDGSSSFKTQRTKCLCYGRNEVCNICLSRATEAAPRGGTAGFRAPEVLLKLQEQTTAVDMWSAGVIFLSLLSGRYPFFRAVDDLSSLAEIMTILGTSKVQKAAESIGKTITLSTKKPSLDLKCLCQKLRGVKEIPVQDNDNKNGESSSYTIKNNCSISWANVPNSAYDLLSQLLDPNPSSRLTAQEALNHPFITEKIIQ